ncbi:hypothetical protein [Nonomuraea cavernae]|uniref:hypothetical protein n=1 Tax=Nonomuraea cavernae TaxID=2045107 RepID=UPI001669725B|nr:hypothetical protein [Nonomuraea cavernae]MCA2185672.1 hypothetical protein [Nonomuraea cavernae]
MNNVLVGRNLTKRFGRTVALDGVDLAVRTAEAVAIMGPSGNDQLRRLWRETITS